MARLDASGGTVPRGRRVAATGGAEGIVAGLRGQSPGQRHHPLGRLPLFLRELEGRPPMPHYGVNGSGSSAGLDWLRDHDDPLPRPAAVPVVAETTAPPTARALARAVTSWTEGSNGRIEARTFAFAEPVGDVPAALAALDLDCLRGLGPRTGFFFAACPPAEVWDTLFRAASAGGAYSSGWYGAHGRLAAWESLGALSGADPWPFVEEIERRAAGAELYRFGAQSRWYFGESWDIGLAALTDGRRRLAVLAATDTD
ncbi:DUF6183 family protein [Streptomyces litchfieldiae]|uniref:DUF6183 family protein n=1 Tax=Streptomyces litchfieldiae TaxID=3075543 RepID=A0ABU2MKZ4_9ACTN|nr:DUF6183 family protein [Streptomyces sp. DSM 44938]MDT0341588.1 DUF6183 family protein [Streptomyces sp. DSM 44938]